MATTHLPILIDYDKCLEIYRAAEHGQSIKQTSKRLGMSHPQAYKWLREPDTYSPFRDHVALSRAWQEREVYDNLTALERDTFWRAVYDRRMSEETEGGTRAKDVSQEIMDALGFTESDIDNALETVRRRLATNPAGPLPV